MRLADINQASKAQNFKAQLSQQTQFLQKNGGDMLDLRIKKGNNLPSFKGENTAKLFTDKGMQIMMRHFAELKENEPNIADKVDAVKNFVLEFNSKAKENGVHIHLSWHDVTDNPKMSFKNLVYDFKNPRHGTVYGKSEDLYEIIKRADLVDKGQKIEFKPDAGEEDSMFPLGTFWPLDSSRFTNPNIREGISEQFIETLKTPGFSSLSRKFDYLLSAILESNEINIPFDSPMLEFSSYLNQITRAQEIPGIHYIV